ncbi:phage polarity suppression protein [Providencia rettgeri]|uniref:phage polarity suppression protein n=1 Tax=Providencia TaxID=586 RepID=UPI0032DAA8EA
MKPEIVRERSAASVREVLSVHLVSGRITHYTKDDWDIMTTIGFRLSQSIE